MSLQRRSLFGPADNAPSNGDGGDGATLPFTGQTNPEYRAPVPMPRQLTVGGDQDSAETRLEREGLTATFNEAKTVASQFVGSGASGVQVGRGEDTFSTSGSASGGSSSTTTGGSDQLATRTAGADDGTGFGKAIG
jgi:hypothetical protein